MSIASVSNPFSGESGPQGEQRCSLRWPRALSGWMCLRVSILKAGAAGGFSRPRVNTEIFSQVLGLLRYG